MAWHWWLIIGWLLCGLIALVMEFRDNAAMRINVGLVDVWPVLLGPVWLITKLAEWYRAWSAH